MKSLLKIAPLLFLLFLFNKSMAQMPLPGKITAKFKIATPPVNATLIKVISIRTENMYERMDPNYLGMQFRLANKGYYGLEAESLKPLLIRLYMNIDEPVDEDFLKSVVEKKELQMPVHGGGTKLVLLNFLYFELEKQIDTITRRAFLEKQFDTYSKKFSKNTENWGGKNEAIYELVYPDLDKPLITRSIPYLSSHLSQSEGFLGIQTLINDNEEYAFRITYSKDVLDDDKIWKILTKDKWTTISKEGEVVQIEPQISFTNKGATITPTQVN